MKNSFFNNSFDLIPNRKILALERGGGVDLRNTLGLILALWLTACSGVSPFPSGLTGPFVPQTGSIQNGEDMAELQSRLNKLGFSAGRVDGSFGPKTANAIRAYQLKYGQHIDGKPTYTLLANVQKDLPANGHNDTGTGLGTLFAAFEEPTPKILISTYTQL